MYIKEKFYSSQNCLGYEQKYFKQTSKKIDLLKVFVIEKVDDMIHVSLSIRSNLNPTRTEGYFPKLSFKVSQVS